LIPSADYPQAAGLARLLDRLDSTNQLCKTIIYNLNPADNEVIATMLGKFSGWFVPRQDSVRRGLVVHGSEGRYGAPDERALRARPCSRVSWAC